MKMTMPKLSTVFCSVLVLMIPCVANATILGTVDIEHTGFGASDAALIWGSGEQEHATYTGVYILDKTDGTGQGNYWPNGQLGGFCIELNQHAPKDSYEYKVVQLANVYNSFLGEKIGHAKADYISELWGRFYDQAWAGAGPFTMEQNLKAESFAIAIWEIICENLPGSPSQWDVFSDGTAGPRGFRCEFADTTANNWLNSLTGTGPKADLRAFVNSCRQDYVVQVPEPATISLFAIAGILSYARKRSR